MRRATRWAVSTVVVVHGLLHVHGVVGAFGWTDVAQLTEPIGIGLGFGWLAAALLVTASGALLDASVDWWWIVGSFAVVVSQYVIATSWSDARAGTAANVILGAAALHGFLSRGPTSPRATYRWLADDALASVASNETPTSVLVTVRDLDHLPAPVAAYVTTSGAVGQPHVGGFRARISGRIRSGRNKAWIPFTGEQVDTYGSAPSRVFFMDATMFGLPVDVLHTYLGPAARMQVKVASVFSMVDATGPEMDQAETVTLLNDLCVLAPAALIDAPIRWTPIDDHHTRAEFTNASHVVSAELSFNDEHELVDFVSDDRFRASDDGRTFIRQRWSTPISQYRKVGPRRVGVVGAGRWHPPAQDGPYDYLDFHVDEIKYYDLPMSAQSTNFAG